MCKGNEKKKTQQNFLFFFFFFNFFLSFIIFFFYINYSPCNMHGMTNILILSLLRRTLVLVLRVLSLEWISLRMEPISNSNIIHIASFSFTSPFLFFFLSLTCLFTFSSFLGLWSVFLVYSNFLLFLLCFLNLYQF